ncbi:MAG: hypothetical protein IAE80_07605 [Anaerolinea sp.]|nr:hypothetical protein [Anaerolinea sp.]
MRQKLMLLLTAALLMAFAIFATLVPAKSTSAAPLACNPCDCENDNRENCQGIDYYAMYARGVNNVCTLDFYRFDGAGQGYRVMRVRETELDDLPDYPNQNVLLRRNEGIALYQLSSGEFQVNAGPDASGKIYVLIFNLACPAEVLHEQSILPGQ